MFLRQLNRKIEGTFLAVVLETVSGSARKSAFAFVLIELLVGSPVSHLHVADRTESAAYIKLCLVRVRLVL